jgi:SRSO17 transposase
MSEDFVEEIKQEIDTCLAHLRTSTSRKNTWESMCDYIKGLMSTTKRKNSWQIARKMGDASPYRFQYLLYCAKIDVSTLQRELTGLTLEKLGSDGVLSFEDVIFPKRGDLSVGTEFQKTTGRSKNCQIGVFMGYGAQKGHTIINASLHLPESWILDSKRCKDTGIPENTVFLSKPHQAIAMWKTFTFQGGVCKFVVAGQTYGGDPNFTQDLEKFNQPYVVAIPKDYPVSIHGKLRRACKWGNEEEWVMLERDEIDIKGYKRFLLMRHNSFYSVFAKDDVSLQEVVRVQSYISSMEKSIKIAVTQVGLDDYEVRSFQGWNRHMILALWALGIFVFLKNKVQMIEENQ